ncbi:MAG: riboflavin synthase [Ferruginibacter sp.]|nr:riboflavin synthase [Ferruginibacter sp.]
MFTGIIETTGIVSNIITTGTNKTFWITSSISSELTIDQSISHNGVCLTVEEVKNGQHRVTSIEETLKKTNLSTWETGMMVNLERCLTMSARLDGHIVQGHVDTVATCLGVTEKDGSWEYTFQFDRNFSALIIEKGSISVNGISLTVFNVSPDTFSVAIIPYTYHHTNLQFVAVNDSVNIEFDMIGKYVNRFMQLK